MKLKPDSCNISLHYKSKLFSYLPDTILRTQCQLTAQIGGIRPNMFLDFSSISKVFYGIIIQDYENEIIGIYVYNTRKFVLSFP